MLPWRILAVILALGLIATACGSDADPTETAAESTESSESTETETTDADAGEEAETATTAAVEADDAAETPADPNAINGGKPEVEIPEGDAPLQLDVVDLIEGDGEVAESGSLLSMHYVGVLHDNGEQFDASWDRGATFDFQLGSGQVIQGWDEGIEGMRVGGRRVLTIPPEQAYGNNATGSIPANSTLVFVVDLVDVVTLPDIENIDAPVTDLEVTVIEEGDGEEIVAGSFVEMHFQALIQSSGESLGSSYSQGPLPFEVGAGQAPMTGWDEGVIGLRAGDIAQILIPPALGGDEVGFPGETLVTVVEIVSVSN